MAFTLFVVEKCLNIPVVGGDVYTICFDIIHPTKREGMSAGSTLSPVCVSFEGIYFCGDENRFETYLLYRGFRRCVFER